MPVIAVVNRKGGSGKSTLATHVAAWLARGGERVMLGDVDRQQSAVPWLKRRQARALPGAPLVGWAMDARNVMRPPAGVRHVVLDTPGGLHGFGLSRLLMYADIVLMPVSESIFDRESAAACLGEMRMHPRVAAGRTQIAAVGMRIDARTRAPARLRAWAADHSVPLVGVVREARAYVRCAESGLSIFDLPVAKVQMDLAQWQPVLEWLTHALATAAAQQGAAAPVHAKEQPTRGAVVMRRSVAVSGSVRSGGVQREVAAAAAAGAGEDADAGLFVEVAMNVEPAAPMAVSPVTAQGQTVPPTLAAAMPVLQDELPLPLGVGLAPLTAAAPEGGDLAGGNFLRDAPDTEAGPATVFPGDLMRPLVPPPTGMARLRRLLRKLLPPTLQARARY